MDQPEIVTIVNSYNRLPLLKEALPSLDAALQAYGCLSAIVVFEAGSTDGSKEWLENYRAANSAVRLDIVSPQDDGTSFSAGVNAACAYAAAKFPCLKYFLLFETDNWIGSPQPLRQATALLDSEAEMGAVGFTVRRHSGEAAGYGSPFPTALSFVLGQQLTARLHLESPQVKERQIFGEAEWHYHDVVYTSPLLVKKDAWLQSGGLDAAAFPFSDCDLDWAWRLRKAGWRMAVLEAQDVVHDNREQLSQWSATRVLTFHRARYRLLHRHRGRWVTALRPLLFVRHLLEYVFLFATMRGTPNHAASLKKRRTLLQTTFRGYKA